MTTPTRPSRDQVRAHRERLREQGLRPIQIWVPDVRSPAFKAEAHRLTCARREAAPHLPAERLATDCTRPIARVRMTRGSGQRKAFAAGSMNVKIVVHEAEEGGFWAEVPALPGCVSQGETMDELLANMREAIQAWLDTAPPDDTQPTEPRQVVELTL
jgi:predicted RNase H-like HicB family nuclease